MDIKIVRFITGKTQQEFSAITGIVQSRISTVERGFSILNSIEQEKLNRFLESSDVDLHLVQYIEMKRSAKHGNS